MRQLLSIFVFALAASAQTGGWIDLTPDAKLTNWVRVPIPPTAPLGQTSQWKVENGVIVCEGNGGHDMLRYDREFQDFILHVEWRFAELPGEPRYNSGVFVRTNADGSIWHQAQTGLAGGYLFMVTPVKGINQRISFQKQMKENRVKRAGEWNTYEVTAKGRTMSLDVNGATVSEFTECEVPKGYVGLEAEGYRVEFRNLRIKPL